MASLGGMAGANRDRRSNPATGVISISRSIRVFMHWLRLSKKVYVRPLFRPELMPVKGRQDEARL